tara:strand:+ start:144 stop:320 length:177 start_codon:yes stop_codon:yes gene_type:complete
LIGLFKNNFKKSKKVIIKINIQKYIKTGFPGNRYIPKEEVKPSKGNIISIKFFKLYVP